MIIIRNILAIIVGLLVGRIINMAIVALGSGLILPPVGVDGSDVESIRASIHLYEAKHFIIPWLAHALGTIVGSVFAFVIAASHKSTIAYGIGIVFLAVGLAMSVIIPAPVWFVVLDLVGAYIPMAWYGVHLGQRLDQRKVIKVN